MGAALFFKSIILYNCSVMPHPVKKEITIIVPSHSNPILQVLIRLVFGRRLTFSLLILAGLVPPEYKVRIFNQRIFWRDSDFTKDSLVGISCSTVNAIRSYALADRCRRAGAYVVMGGAHVSAFPEEALQHCDSVVVDEAESVWPEIIRDFENRSLKPIYHGQPQMDFFSAVYPYFLKLPAKTLLQVGLMTSRGCKYRCEFCVQPMERLRMVKMEQILSLVRRIKEKYNNPLIPFWDDNIYSNPTYAKELFRALIPLKVRWVANTSIDIAWDEEALRLAQESGCEQFFIGFDVVHPTHLPKTSVQQMSSLDDYLEPIQRIHQHKIRIVGAFILGFDEDTHRDYLHLLIFLFKAKIFLISLTLLTPFPQTALYKKMKQENRITTFDWRKYHTFGLVHKPKKMSVAGALTWYWAFRLITGFLGTGPQRPLLMMVFLIALQLLGGF